MWRLSVVVSMKLWKVITVASVAGGRTSYSCLCSCNFTCVIKFETLDWIKVWTQDGGYCSPRFQPLPLPVALSHRYLAAHTDILLLTQISCCSHRYLAAQTNLAAHTYLAAHTDILLLTQISCCSHRNLAARTESLLLRLDCCGSDRKFVA